MRGQEAIPILGIIELLGDKKPVSGWRLIEFDNHDNAPQ
jgi:hypothetical protein